jgi:phosphohistidine phosphatase
MLKLALIRHAKSSWENSALDDMVRPLNQRGHENTILMGNYLLQQRFHPKQIISSPATRALHTAINLSSWIGYNKNKIEIDSVLYFGKISNIVKLLQSNPAKNDSLCIVGHEPLLSELITYFCGEIEFKKFPTCSVVFIQFDIKQWSETLKNKGTLVSFITPKDLI